MAEERLAELGKSWRFLRPTAAGATDHEELARQRRAARFRHEARLPAPELPRHRITVNEGKAVISDPVDALLKLALRIVLHLNELRQTHSEHRTKLIESKELQLNRINEQLVDRGVLINDIGCGEELKECLKRRQAASDEHNGPSRAGVGSDCAGQALRLPTLHEARDRVREDADPWVARHGALSWRRRDAERDRAKSGRRDELAEAAVQSVAPRLSAEEDAARRRARALRGEATRAEKQRLYANRRRSLEVMAATGVLAREGLLVHVRLPIQRGQLEHERWRLARILTVHPEDAGDVKIAVSYPRRGGRWQGMELPSTLQAGPRAGTLTSKELEERLLFEPTADQYMLSLTGIMVLGVEPLNGFPPTVGWRELPSRTDPGGLNSTHGAAIEKDRVGASAEGTEGGSPTAGDKVEARSELIDDCARMTLRVLTSYSARAAGLSAGSGVEGDLGLGSDRALAQHWLKHDGALGDAARLAMASKARESTVATVLARAAWLVGRLLDRTGDHEGIARIRDDKSGSTAWLPVLPAELLFRSLARICEQNTLPQLKPSATLGQALHADEQSLLCGMATDVPDELAWCSKGGLWSIMDAHCLLLSVAARIAAHRDRLAWETRAGTKAESSQGASVSSEDKDEVCELTRRHSLGRGKANPAPGLAEETSWGTQRAKHELEQLRERAQIVGRPLLTRPTASVERERMHRVMAWNANGLTLRDARPDRLALGRTKQMAETAQRQFAEALAAQLQENDAAGDEGDGSALKHRGDDKLEALIEYIASHKVAAIAISEVHGQLNNGRDLLDYLGMRLNWRAQRPAAKWKGVLPEYDPCFVYSAPDKDDHGGVLWGWDPNVMEKVEADHVYQGRVLRVRMRMLLDDRTFDNFVCYMPVSSKSAEFHKKVWMALIEAASASMSSCMIMGDLNAETASRLKKTHGIDITKKAGKRQGETYLYKLMNGLFSEDGAVWTRVGSEKTTFQCVDQAADGENEELFSYHVIDHCLRTSHGMDNVRSAGTHFVHGEKQYHLSVEVDIVTTATELVQTSSNMKPKLARMPQQPPVATSSRANALAKRAVERADALPERDFTDAGHLVDDAEVSDDELFERDASSKDADMERIGWEAYMDKVADEAVERLKDYVANQELALSVALEVLERLDNL